MMKRSTKNDRTITLTEPALKVYDSWPHMEKSKRASEAIANYTGTGLEARLEDIEKRLERLERGIERMKGASL